MIVLSACSEKTSSTIVMPVESLSNTITYSQNPYDSVGINHNILMTYSDSLFCLDYLNSERWDNIQPFSPQFKDLICSYGAKAFALSHIDNSQTQDGLNLLFDSTGIYEFSRDLWVDFDITTIWDSIHTNILSQYSYKDSLYTAKVLDVFKNTIQNDRDSLYLVNSLASLQSEMLQQSWDSNDFLAFCTVSVAIHSVNFWFNYDFDKLYPDDNSKIAEYNNKNSELCKPKKKGISKKERDKVYIAATAAGDVMGAVLGSSGGPAGTLGGAWGGTKLGFAVSSAVETLGSWLSLW